MDHERMILVTSDQETLRLPVKNGVLSLLSLQSYFPGAENLTYTKVGVIHGLNRTPCNKYIEVHPEIDEYFVRVPENYFSNNSKNSSK